MIYYILYTIYDEPLPLLQGAEWEPWTVLEETSSGMAHHIRLVLNLHRIYLEYCGIYFIFLKYLEK